MRWTESLDQLRTQCGEVGFSLSGVLEPTFSLFDKNHLAAEFFFAL